MPTAETLVSDDSLANLVDAVNQRLLVLTDGEHPAYVGSELPAVDRALSRIQNEGLARGPVFCEWGSGLGGVCGVAAINGFTPYGIEIQRELVASARLLASDLNYAMVFAEGTFLLPGDEELAAGADSHTRLEFNARAWDELELTPEDCDVVFAYPWPNEEAFVDNIFRRHASADALLLTFHDLGRMLVQRKVSHDTQLQTLGWM
jgi:hypothetical protein